MHTSSSESVESESVTQQEEESTQQTEESSVDGDYHSIDSSVDSVMCKLDSILQAVDSCSISDQERLALRRKAAKCQGTLGVLVNTLGAETCNREHVNTLNADQTRQADLGVNLYSQLYTRVLLNLFSGANPPALGRPPVPDPASNSPIDTQTATNDPTDDCSQLSCSSNPAQEPEGNFWNPKIFVFLAID